MVGILNYHHHHHHIDVIVMSKAKSPESASLVQGHLNIIACVEHRAQGRDVAESEAAGRS